MQTITIDQSAPMPVARPASVAELGDIIKQARAAKQGIYPLGGRTTLDVGLPPTKSGIAVDLTGLNAVIDYPARDMTITVQAGITVAAVQTELAREGQWLPLDVASPEVATLGGALALNQSGPRRYGYGTLRDYVIGISFMTDDGIEVKAGGRVVKNVAGYDLMKLQIGAVGTLGVITQVTLKVKPRPDSSATVVFGCDADSLAVALDQLHATATRPVAVELLNAAAWRAIGSTSHSDSAWVIAVGFEEKAVTVRWQVAALLDELKAVSVRDAGELSESAALWAKLAEMQLRAESRYIGKVSVQPSQTASVIRTFPTAAPIHAHALNGVIWVHGEAPTEGAIVRRCPVEVKKSLAIWGKPPAAWDMMRHVKATLDPDNVFNPGRLFGDI